MKKNKEGLDQLASEINRNPDCQMDGATLGKMWNEPVLRICSNSGFWGDKEGWGKFFEYFGIEQTDAEYISDLGLLFEGVSFYKDSRDKVKKILDPTRVESINRRLLPLKKRLYVHSDINPIDAEYASMGIPIPTPYPTRDNRQCDTMFMDLSSLNLGNFDHCVEMSSSAGSWRPKQADQYFFLSLVQLEADGKPINVQKSHWN